MKLTIENEEYTLYWGLPAFGLASEELGGMTPYEIIGDMGNPNTANTITYFALLLGYRIEKDDKFAKLPFGEMKFVKWLEQQPQELANGIFKDFLEFSTHEESWAKRLQIDIEKLFPSEEQEEKPKKKATSKRTPKSS